MVYKMVCLEHVVVVDDGVENFVESVEEVNDLAGGAEGRQIGEVDDVAEKNRRAPIHPSRWLFLKLQTLKTIAAISQLWKNIVFWE